MDIHEFKRILNLGLGRTILYSREHDPAPYREAILEDCLHHQEFDSQLDPERDEYLFDLIQLAGKAEYFRGPILEALGSLTEEGYAVTRLFGLARRFAQRGDEQARRVMYEHFAQFPQVMEQAANQFTELDGIEGLRFVAETLGAEMLKDPDYEANDGLVYWLEDRGSMEMLQPLRQGTPVNPAVEAYLARLEWRFAHPLTLSPSRVEPITSLPYAQVKERLSRQILPMTVLIAWGREASEADLLQAAEDLLVLPESPGWRLRAYLQIFHARRFPLPPGRLFALARGASEPRTAFMALGAMAPLATPEVLAYARELLESGKSLYRVVPMLFARYPAEDHAAVEKLLQRDLDAEELHSAGMAVRHLVEQNLQPSATPALTLIYERGPCANCREEAIRLLMALQTLPDWMAAEARYDVSEHIRKLMEDTSG